METGTAPTAPPAAAQQQQHGRGDAGRQHGDKGYRSDRLSDRAKKYMQISGRGSESRSVMHRCLDAMFVFLVLSGSVLEWVYLGWIDVHTKRGQGGQNRKSWDKWVIQLSVAFWVLLTFTCCPYVAWSPAIHTFFMTIAWVYMYQTSYLFIDVCQIVSTGIRHYCRFARVGFVGWVLIFSGLLGLLITSSLRYRHIALGERARSGQLAV